MAIKPIEDSRQVIRSTRGLSASLAWTVTEVQSEDDALDHQGIPQPGEPYPGRGFAIATSITAKPSGPNVFIVTVQYAVPDRDSNVQPVTPGASGVIELGVATSVIRTTRDINGNQIVVAYRQTLATGEFNDDFQGGEVEYEASQLLLIQRRTETFPPMQKSRFYSNTVNRRKIWGFAKGTLFCHPITAVSNDGGETYQVTYQFQEADTWRATATYKDKKTGKPPNDLVQGVGVVDVEIYRETDFSDLNLQFPG